jgi:LysM repeat protein
MNPFTPILPPGSPLARVSAQRRSRVRMVVFIVVAVNVCVLTALLIQGCIHTQHNAATADTAATNVLVSPATANASAPARLPVVVSNSQSRAPRVSALRPASPPVAPAITPKSAPLPAAQGVTVKNYSVVKGDTYSKIAKANGVSVSALAKANPDVDATKLKIGQLLHIPVVGQKQTLSSSNATHASVKDKQ